MFLKPWGWLCGVQGRQGWKHNCLSATSLWDVPRAVCRDTSCGSKSSWTSRPLGLPGVSRVERERREPSPENYSPERLDKPCDKQE